MANLTALALLVAQAQAGGNVLANPSFEGKGDAPAGWSTYTWRGEADFSWEKEGRDGGRCVRITSKKGADAAWKTEVPVKPHSLYRLSGWVRTENVNPGSGRGVLFNIHNLAKTHTPPVNGTADWTRVEVLFETGDLDSIQINCLFGGWGKSTGAAWYDDLSVQAISTETMKPSATIELDKTGAPISKYIYSQFIEHLGRCIYGGIWAEMLEDRKFYHAVDDNPSPWRTFGGAACTMNVPRAYVGEHSPLVSVSSGPPAGIRQDGLPLSKGKYYDGRIVAAALDGIEELGVRITSGDSSQVVTRMPVTGEYATKRFSFMAQADDDNASLEVYATGTGELLVGAVSLMPADNVKGMRTDTLALLRALDAPLYRWPGGNFVSGYDWRDGIGDPDKRPPRKNPAWRGVEHNDFGIDEFMTYCRELGTEPLVVVNTGAGQVDMALEELQYANGAADTPMGKRRVANGHPEPYNVIWWGIGNEMYGSWQIGHMPLADYVKKHNAFVDAMRAEDPRIRVIAVGATGAWSETMLAQCADHMDLLSEHFYNQEKEGLLSHVRQIPNSVRAKAEAHRKYLATIPALKDKPVPIALDEWNYWYGDHVYGELGTRYFLKDALGIAAGIQEMTRHSDIFQMANYAQTVNVIGCIKTTKTHAAFATTGLALMLYRKHYGVLPVEVAGDTMPLDVSAALTEDGKKITIGVVNPTHEPFELELGVKTGALSGEGEVWRITGPDEMAYNTPGEEPNVRLTSQPVSGIKDRLQVPPVSVSLYVLDLK